MNDETVPMTEAQWKALSRQLTIDPGQVFRHLCSNSVGITEYIYGTWWCCRECGAWSERVRVKVERQ